jgi:hypothetical protein
VFCFSFLLKSEEDEKMKQNHYFKLESGLKHHNANPSVVVA